MKRRKKTMEFIIQFNILRKNIIYFKISKKMKMKMRIFFRRIKIYQINKIKVKNLNRNLNK